MSESDSDNGPTLRKRRANNRASIESDDDLPGDGSGMSRRRSSRTTKKIPVVEISSSSESEEEFVKPSKRRRTPSKRTPPRRHSSDNGPPELSGRAKSFINAPFESARDRFLQDNDDSSMDDFIADDDEEDEKSSTTAHSSSSEEETQPIAGSGDRSSEDTIVEETTPIKPKPSSSNSACTSKEGKIESGEDDDDEIVTPKCHDKKMKKKKTPQNRIHSDESEAEEQAEGPIKTEQTVPEISQQRKKKKRRRRVLVEPESQELAETNQNDNADTNQLSEESDSSEETDDDFIVSDSDSVSGEDGADPLIYPEEEYELSAHQNMDHQQAFTVVIEAFLNRASDENFFQMDDFLKSQGLSQAFKKIFDKIDTIINDLKSQAWSKPFVSALQLTKLSSVNVGSESDGVSLVSCEVCHWKNRYATCRVSFNGYKYNPKSLKPIVESVSSDSDSESTPIKTEFFVGRYCESRAILYHDVLHYKRNLLDSCQDKVKKKGLMDEPLEEMVQTVLNDTGWIDLEYRNYKTLLKASQKLIGDRSSNSRWMKESSYHY